MQTESLRVTVTDQNSGLIPDVVVRLKNEKGLVKEIKSSDDENISFSKLVSRKYILEIEAKGFKPVSQEIEIKAGRNEIVVKLEISEIVENVQVERDKQDKALDSQSGAFSHFLTKSEMEALPDDPQELEKALKDKYRKDAIIRVDGFSGKMPPKSQIASIRVTRSSFDAEYHTLGSTIIDIISKAGGGKWTGSVSFNFNDESFNARNPFALRRFPTQRRTFDAFFLGPIVKGKTSVFGIISGEDSYKQENIFAITPNGQFNGSVRNSFRSFYPFIKISHNLSKDRSLNISYSSGIRNSSNEGVGGFDLPERAFSSKSFSQQLRVSESGYLGKRFLNEVRFQFSDESLKTTPASDKMAIIVLDAFNAGGAGNFSRSRRQNFWLADNLLFGAGKIHALKIGGIFEFERQNLESATNRNGTFTFSSLDDFIRGTASTFTQSAGVRTVNFSQFQIGFFAQDDIRLSRSFLLSLGLRYEWQNNLRDKNNFSPRIGFTWSPYKNGKMTFRGGAGVYYDWFGTNNLATILNQSILQPPETVVINPNFPNPLQSGTSLILPPSYRQKDDGLKNPSIFLASIGVERQLNKTTFLRVLYKYQKGSHQFRSRDINAPLDFVRPNPDFGRILQVESSAFFARNSLNVELNGRLTKTLSFAADYTLAKNVNDTNGIFGLPSDNYNLRLDRAVSNLDQRHRLYALL
ncbi:MAG: TonB-dependent receptor domain-containing protein [Pyrinomonadaceae bacterium]